MTPFDCAEAERATLVALATGDAVAVDGHGIHGPDCWARLLAGASECTDAGTPAGAPKSLAVLLAATSDGPVAA